MGGTDRPDPEPGQPEPTWRVVARGAVARVKAHEVSLVAAGLAFFAMLAVVPALLAVVSVYGLVADPEQVADQIASLTENLPETTSDFLQAQLEGLTTSAPAGLGFSTLIALLAALWTVSSATKALIRAINVAFDTGAQRSFARLRGTALLLALALAVTAALTLGAVVAVPVVLRDLGGPGRMLAGLVRWPILLGVLVVALSYIYWQAPVRAGARPRFRPVSAGALVAALAILAGTVGFSVYVESFGRFNETYGTLAGIIVLLLWLYLASFAIVVGAEVDAELTAGRSDPESGP